MGEKTKELVVQETKTELDIDINEATIKRLIYVIRGQQVMLDSDLAMLYHVETKVVNQAVKRNMERFPKEFCFQLTREEYNSLRSQIVTSKGGRRYLPYVFTEQGIAMLSVVLRSDVAIQVSIRIMNNKITLSPWMGNKEEILDVTDDSNFDWNGFYEKMDQRYRKFEDSIKFDVNDQVQYCFENFVDYCWNNK